MTTRKYYVRVPSEFSHDGHFYWQELYDVKTLTQAQHYVDRHFGGLSEPEIWVTKNGGMIKIVSKKTEDKWRLLYDKNTVEHPNFKYDLNGMPVSEEDFYKYGFQHEKGYLESYTGDQS